LAIVQKIISDHGGQIILKNDKKSGANISLVLPKNMEQSV
tara:strand:- start:63 stop:182 length:120 start_codon:yes stop_codon:yes gene_type:complete